MYGPLLSPNLSLGLFSLGLFTLGLFSWRRANGAGSASGTSGVTVV